MKIEKVKMDLDNAIIGKINLTNRMVAVYLSRLYEEINDLKTEIEELKREIRP